MKVIDALYEIVQDNKNIIAIKSNDFLMKLIGNMSYKELIEGLNSEVEIIEDTSKEDKKIKKLDMSDTHYMIDHTEIMEKINEIIDKVNGD